MSQAQSELVAEPGAAPPRFSVPGGVRAYAVGDIHGQAGLLRTLQGMIDADIAASPPAKIVEIYLGDYIDRGPESAAVIEALTQPRPHRTVFLRGNHEDYLDLFLAGRDVLSPWLKRGGLATLASYGIDPRFKANQAPRRRALVSAMPGPHRAFIASLKLGYRLGDVFFVHAGIRPGVPIERQERDDLLTIRRAFLEGDPVLPVRVVHGHTPQREPQVTPYRIGIDTGAFATGRLTCAVLEGDGVRFLSTNTRPAGRERADEPAGAPSRLD